jgi:hypothetical protein
MNDRGYVGLRHATRGGCPLLAETSLPKQPEELVGEILIRKSGAKLRALELFRVRRTLRHVDVIHPAPISCVSGAASPARDTEFARSGLTPRSRGSLISVAQRGARGACGQPNYCVGGRVAGAQRKCSIGAAYGYFR